MVGLGLKGLQVMMRCTEGSSGAQQDMQGGEQDSSRLRAAPKLPE